MKFLTAPEKLPKVPLAHYVCKILRTKNLNVKLYQRVREVFQSSTEISLNDHYYLWGATRYSLQYTKNNSHPPVHNYPIVMFI